MIDNMNKTEVLSFSFDTMSRFEMDQRALILLLESKGWQSVSILGAGRNGKYLYALLSGSQIKIKTVYDNSAEGSLGEHDIVDFKSINTNTLGELPLILAINREAEGVDLLLKSLQALDIQLLVFEASKQVSSIGESQLKPRSELNRMSLEGGLEHLKQKGFKPNTIVDVGAAFGHWAVSASKVYSDPKFLLIEPLQQEFSPFLDAFKTKHAEIDCELVYAAASDRDGEAIFNVHDDWTSSSLMKESEGAYVDGAERKVNTRRLSNILKGSQFEPPFLLKVDTQGNEIKVLEGCGDMLEFCEVVILETSFFPFFNEGPLFHEVVAYMKEQGFLIYDVITLHYKMLDNALAQADIVFVKDSSKLFEVVDFATPEQRRIKVSAFNESIAIMKKNI